jgi:hypothetical protein
MLTRNVIESGLFTFVNKQMIDTQNNLEKREQIVRESLKQLEEAKQAAPALFAKPGDLFEWFCDSNVYNENCDVEPCVIEYLGRNETAPISIELQLGGINFTRKSPAIGWLVFRYVRGQHINERGYGIRYALDAFPQCLYQQYNDEGQAEDDTICIPPAVCGLLRAVV